MPKRKTVGVVRRVIAFSLCSTLQQNSFSIFASFVRFCEEPQLPEYYWFLITIPKSRFASPLPYLHFLSPGLVDKINHWVVVEEYDVVRGWGWLSHVAILTSKCFTMRLTIGYTSTLIVSLVQKFRCRNITNFSCVLAKVEKKYTVFPSYGKSFLHRKPLTPNLWIRANQVSARHR